MRAIAIAVLLVALTGSAATACPPPDPPTASITLCGDPRALIDLAGEGTVRIVFWSGRTGERVRLLKDVDGPRSLKRWVRNKVSVYDQATGEVLARIKVTRSNITGPCPKETPE